MSSDQVAEEGVLPDPPDPSALDPLVEVWPRGRSFFRCHELGFEPRSFNPGFGRGRFHPLKDISGTPVPTLYAANRIEGALSETVFHDIPVRGALKVVRRERLKPMGLSRLSPRRDLSLLQLHGFGLLRLGVSREELIASNARHYPQTVLWAQALHACRAQADGLVWVSRQHDKSVCLVLFGGRVNPEDLRVIQKPRPLATSAFEHVERAAESAGISIVD